MKLVRKTLGRVSVQSFRSLLLPVLLVGISAVPRAAIAVPRIMVGDGTPASCNQTTLQNALFTAALTVGGVIRFDCGGGPVTIELSPSTQLPSGPDLALTVPDNTTIDGEGLITLESTASEVLLFADVGSDVTIRNLAIYGSLNESVLNLGTLAARNVTFSNDRSGAIINEGTLTVTNSTFSDTVFVPAIWNDGRATIDQSVFFNNRGGAVYNSDSVHIRNSIFSGNGGSNSGERGGAIANDGTLVVNNCTFSHHRAMEGGAILSYGRLTVLNSTFSDNVALNPGGGAISTGGTAVIRNSEILDNGATWGGAISNGGVLTIVRSTISRNYAVEGGGIYNTGTLIAASSLIMANTASDEDQLGGGGGIHGSVTASLTLMRTTVIGNSPNDIWPIP